MKASVKASQPKGAKYFKGWRKEVKRVDEGAGRGYTGHSLTVDTFAYNPVFSVFCEENI